MNEDLHDALARMPKIELHHHIEGAAPPDFVRRMASEKRLDVSNIFDAEGAYCYRDFLQFLDVYEQATQPLTSPDDYRRLTRAVLEEARERNVIYLESFVSPAFCGGYDVVAWKEYLHAIREGAAEVPGIAFRVIATAVRHFGPDAAKASAVCAQETAGDHTVGFGIGGDENFMTPRDFAYAFDAAREAGLRLTAHAGEWGGAKSVREAIEAWGIERVGHGVQAIDDPSLVDYLAASGIVLEVCPGSNVALGVYPSVADHPIAKLREAGVRVTVSTDDPPFFHTDMTKEFVDLSEAFGWTVEDFDALNRVALDAAFCDATTRAHLRDRLETYDG
ncbi:adenosine deaminase [Maritimibacter sp. DP1N21-5]|uniref:adenosine deaminase n=1 Tax=Maritimibacter sp. DP1N21-5 TaxID=2836867 RepID=UPI001C47F4ED|nr:adenosine deaminase [Maritimibacter sp. DP1N21-5]MBV7409201.1 adenosine deaminase [Maritimibacter sp. DP1N21-5]